MFDPLPAEARLQRARARDPRPLGARGHLRALRAQNRGGPKWSFVDGPVTANKKLAVHTAWGRTLKDVFQRYKALRGFDQRYQNGFDCQGLWIEVGVERQLGPQLEARDRGVRPRGVRRAAAARSSSSRREELTRGCDPARPVDGLGQRLLHLQRHEHRVHLAVPEDRPRARLALRRPPRDRVVPALRHLALAARADAVAASTRRRATRRSIVRFPLLDRARRVGRGLDDDAVDAARERRRRRQSRRASTGCARTASGCSPRASPTTRSCGASTGSELVGLRYRGPVRQPRRRARRSSTASSRGTRCRSRRARASSTSRPGCGGEDFELGRALGLPVLTPVDEAGRFYDDYGWLHGLSTIEAADQIVGDLAERGFLVEAGHVPAQLPALLALRHAAHLPASPTTGSSRVDERPPSAARGERDGRVGARVHGQAHGRLAAQHGRLEHLAPPLLRPAAAVLPVRVRAPERDRVEGRARASARSSGFDAAPGAAPPVDRPRADPLRGLRRARHAGHRGRRRLARRRDRPVLDARLAEPGVDRPRATRPAPPRADARPTCPTTPTGRSGSRPTGSPRCASRSGSGSTRSSSCRSCSSAGRRSSACSATRRCSTSTAARCTARGGT